MTLRYRETPDRIIVCFTDLTDAKFPNETRNQELRKGLLEICQHAAAAAKKLIVDFRDVRFMSSAGIGQLVLLNKTANQQSLDLRLANVPWIVLHVFEITRIDRAFQFDDCDEGQDLERATIENIDTLVAQLQSPSTSVRRTAAIELYWLGAVARTAIPKMITAFIADPSLGYWLANAVNALGPPDECIDELVAGLWCKESAFWAGRALSGLRSEMSQSVIEHILDADYRNASTHLASARPDRDKTLAAIISLAERDGFFPRHAVCISGSPPTFIGEQIRKANSGKWVAVNCRLSPRMQHFTGVRSAADYFVRSQMCQ